MRKNGLWTTIRNEIIYWILIVIISGFFMYLANTGAPDKLLLITGILNIVVLETWFIRIFLLFSGRKISQYSNVIQRISFIERFFEYFVLPILFLGTFLLFIYFNKSLLMGYWVFVLCMLVIFILFINVKSSLKHIYRISLLTKGVFDFICIVTFYLAINILYRLNLSIEINLILTCLVSFVIFLAELHLHNRLSIISGVIALLSAIFVSLCMGCFIFQSIFTVTAVGTVAFYLIISLWNVRFVGKYKLVDYIPPFLYSLLSLILIFNL
jgi:hypothetical protein